MKENTLATLSGTFLRVVNRYNEIEKMPYSYGTDTLLHPSETHTIESIGNHPNINVTRLAALQGITKGAISKRIQNLRKRGFVDKSISPETENEVVLNLTAKGIQVYEAHAEFSKELNKNIMALYAGLPETTIDALAEIGDQTEQLFIEIAEKRKNI